MRSREQILRGNSRIGETDTTMGGVDEPVFRVASLPGRWGESGLYVRLFYDALKPYGIDCVAELVPEAAWLEQHAQTLDAIHIHWPERIWRDRHLKWVRLLRGVRGYHRFRQITHWPRSFIGLRYLRALLNCAKEHRLRIVWTIHDFEPHERAGWIDQVGYRMLARQCDTIICHSEAARDTFIHTYGVAKKILVMRHGNFTEAYPPPRPRDVVLRSLGLREDLPLVCFLGLLRGYKGLDLCLDAIGKLDGQIQLVIAGAPHGSFRRVRAFSRRVARMANIVFIPKFLSTQEFSDFASASEAFLLPYRRITTSGILHAAFTFHRGVVASDLPYFRESLHENPNCGRLFCPGDATAFAEAIEDYLSIPHKIRTEAAKEFAELHTWDKVVLPVVETFEKWMKQDSTPSIE